MLSWKAVQLQLWRHPSALTGKPQEGSQSGKSSLQLVTSIERLSGSWIEEPSQQFIICNVISDHPPTFQCVFCFHTVDICCFYVF